MRGIAFTAIAMLAFAGNSILCRLALGQGLIDAASFTSVRVSSGAIVLLLIAISRRSRIAVRKENSLAAVMLFIYMIAFSVAYLALSAGTGALILFGFVQLTMIGRAISTGERLTITSWSGLVIAVGGLFWLVMPGLAAPDPGGAITMAVAGIAWGFYSLLGRSQKDPGQSTTINFLLATPLALILSTALFSQQHWTLNGIGLAVASGAITSGLGYVVWYAAVARLTATQAASVQLTVPVIAAILGAVLLSEPLTGRLVLASAAILGGVALVILKRSATTARPDNP